MPLTPPVLPRARRKLAHLRTRARDWWRGETAATFFDLPGPAPADAPLAWKAGLTYQARPDLRAAFPLGLTPRDRGLFLKWMLDHGTRDFGYSEADALRSLWDRDADPSRGLVETFLLQPAWQRAVPHGVTRHGWAELKRWLAAEYGLGSRWFRRAKLLPRFASWEERELLRRMNPALPPAAPPGPAVTLLGLFRYTSGLQQAANGMAAALERAGVRVALRDVPGPQVRENPTGKPLDRLEIADVSIIHTGLDTAVPDAYARAGLAPRDGVYRVTNWWWELEQLPPEWLGRGADVDEVWAPTRFIADALRALGKPVVPMLPGIELPPFAPLGKAHFGMRPDRFTFAALFDANSRLGRKNPLAAVRAFRKAFRPDEPVELVVKMTPPGAAPGADVRELRAVCAAAGVRLVEAVFTRAETLAFLAAADGLVSLHRSEGFGLPLAEAMLLGKPVVATGYSGNLDFMTAENSYLVDHTQTVIAADDPPYRRGFTWAEPSVEHAASLLRRIADRPDEARAVGERARVQVAETLSVAAAGRRMRDRLDAIAEMRKGRSG